MRKRTRTILVVAGTLLALGVLTWQFVEFMLNTGQHVVSQTHHALNETDHAALLETCREMIRDPERYRAGVPGEPIEVKPDQWPEAVRRLRPFYVRLDNTTCRMVMTGGFHYSYVVAFADDPQTPEVPVTFKLMSGLWFYEDGRMTGMQYPPGYPQR